MSKNNQLTNQICHQLRRTAVNKTYRQSFHKTSSIVEETAAVTAAQNLIGRAQVEVPAAKRHVIIDMVATIIWYKFEQLNRSEIEAMLDIPVRETRLYQEGRQEGRQEGEVSIIIRLLQKRIDGLPEAMSTQIKELSLTNLEDLSDSLLDFSELSELQNWLEKANPEQPS